MAGMSSELPFCGVPVTVCSIYTSIKSVVAYFDFVSSAYKPPPPLYKPTQNPFGTCITPGLISGSVGHGRPRELVAGTYCLVCTHWKVFRLWDYRSLQLVPESNQLNQGRSQVSKQDEASLERRRREPLGGSGGMPPQKILKFRGSELLF